MSRRSLGTLTVDIVAQTGGFVQGMTKAERETDRWRRQVEKNMKAGRAAVDRALVGIATAAVGAAAAIAALTRAGAQEISSQAELARSLNTTYDSVTALQEAFRDGGIDNFESSVNRLNRRLGAAELGRGAALNAVKELNLDLQQLASVEVDERIAIIADRIKEVSTNSQVAARYAQDLGFEQREAAQFFLQGGDAIRSYREQVERYGLALSALDVKNVEDMSAAFDNMQRGGQAFRTQLTAELAPAITLVVDELTELVTGAGDVETAAQGMGDAIINASAYAMNSISGVVRSVRDLSSILVAINEVGRIAAPAGVDGSLLAISPVAGLWKAVFGDEAAQKRDVEQSSEIIRKAIADIRARSEEPLAGDAFLERLRERMAEQDLLSSSSERGVTAGGSGVDPEYQKRQDAIAREISAIERAAETWGMSAESVKLYDLALMGATETQLSHAQSQLQTVAYLQLVQDLRTDEERLTDEFHARIAVLDAMAVSARIAGDEYAAMAARAAEAAFSDAPEFSGFSSNQLGMFSDTVALSKSRTELEEWRSEELERLEQFRKERADMVEEWAARELEIEKDYQARRDELQAASGAVQLAIGEELFGNMANLAKEFAGEQSSAYKAMFAVQQAFAVAAIIMNAQIAAAKAPAELTVLGGIPVGAALLASGYANAAMVAAMGLTGMAHDGIDSVPQTGTWLLEKGERVTTAETSAKLDRKLDMIQPGGGGGITIHAPVTVEAQPGASSEDAQKYGRQLAGAMTATAIASIEKEARPGGLLWRLYGGGR